MQFNKSAVWIFLACLIFFCSFQIASAHILQTDGSISAILHIDPDDDPIVSQPALVHFDVDDESRQFQRENCDCNIVIFQNGKQLLSRPLELASGRTIFSFEIPFVFSEKSIYHISLTGSPKNPRSFQNFKLEYDLRVSREMPVPESDNWEFTGFEYLMLAMCGVIAAGGIIFGIYSSRNEEKTLNNKP